MSSLSAAERAAFYLGIKHIASGGSANGSPPGTGEWVLDNLNIQSDDCSSTCGAITAQINGLPSFTSTILPITLTGSPAGGTFSGPGMVFSAFNPSIAGPGTHTISYTYTDGNGCTYTTSQNILVITVTFNTFSKVNSAASKNISTTSVEQNFLLLITLFIHTN